MAPQRNVGDWDPSGRSVPRSVVERIERYGNNGIDLDFWQIAVTADDVRGGHLVSHEANSADSNFKRFREECLWECRDPHEAVEVEALRPGTLRDRLETTIEHQVCDVRQWDILARAEEHDRSMRPTAQNSPGTRRVTRQRPGVDSSAAVAVAPRSSSS
ncbi:hypothetical protein [Streptomyces sp. NPDC002746]